MLMLPSTEPAEKQNVYEAHSSTLIRGAPATRVVPRLL
ncbi:MAG: hypothetical protein AW10_04010 [Candidatus Accumulibacter appositus]|uniref:Uncharacterized protein n=1 Tax=Candidatus Accumulibacter appositus TaxID=1454003 RepID=A0A011NP85_9PROT|nr:MAG: hypothetical protein AW10_04010 [Candidatus Accumulibacter appositus]